MCLPKYLRNGLIGQDSIINQLDKVFADGASHNILGGWSL
jgi:hypothetical protein